MIQVSNIKTPDPDFPRLQSELKPNSLYKDFEGDIYLTDRRGMVVGYFVTRTGDIVLQPIRVTEERDIASYRFVHVTGTIVFS